MVKRVMFVYILELLDGAGHMAFFNLQKGGHKANNAQKEKQCLAWKRSQCHGQVTVSFNHSSSEVSDRGISQIGSHPDVSIRKLS